MKNEDCLKKFGKHLKLLRKKYKFSQQVLADKADIGKRTIQRIEECELNPSLDILCSISLAFGITVKELMDFSYENRKF